MDCCVYIVDAGKLVLIDAGAGKSTGRLIDNIQSLGFRPEELSTVIVTHAHIDHIGSLSELKQLYDLRVIAHINDSPAIESGKRVGAEHYGIKYLPCKVDEKVAEDEASLEIGHYKFKLIHIPGHTPGSIAVMLHTKANKVLFGQDIHGPYHPMWGGDPEKAVDSLIKLRDLDADILCEGHYGIIKPADEVAEFIQEFIDELGGHHR
jgi:glyoxylase-like metal-dependent hydrolase (beta-lactamase superfamily II)